MNLSRVSIITTCMLGFVAQAHCTPPASDTSTYLCRPATRITCIQSNCSREDTEPIHAEFSYNMTDRALQACLHTDCYTGKDCSNQTEPNLFRFTTNGVVRSMRPIDGATPPGMPPFALTLAIDMTKAAFIATWSSSAEEAFIDIGTCQQTITINMPPSETVLPQAISYIFDQLAALLKSSPHMRIEICPKTDNIKAASTVRDYLAKKGSPESSLQIIKPNSISATIQPIRATGWQLDLRLFTATTSVPSKPCCSSSPSFH